MTRFNQAKLIPIQEIAKSCPRCSKSLEYFNNKATCFRCSESYSTIDYVMAATGCNSIEAVNILLDGSVKAVKPVEKRNNYLSQQQQLDQMQQQQLDQQQQRKLQQQKNYNMILRNSISLEQPEAAAAIEYLNRRGILEAIKTLNSEVIQVKYNCYNDIGSIVYRFKKQKTIIKKYLTPVVDPKTGKRIKAVNFGSVEPILHMNYKSNTTTILIVEGIEDALSAHLLGHSFICLNSTSKVNRLKELISTNINWFKDKQLSLCLDNDPVGADATAQLIEFMVNNKLQFNISGFYEEMCQYDIKDLNDLLLKGGILKKCQ